VIRGIEILYKVLTPFSSNRRLDKRSVYGLDFSQWQEIALYAERHSFRETARKFDLSVNSMKRHIKMTDAVAEEFVTCLPHTLQFILKMKRLGIMSTDMELRSLFDRKCKAIFQKLIEDQLSVIKRAQLESERRSNSDIHRNEEQGRRYGYYQIIHGKNEKRCGPFRESELPLELVMQYLQKHQNKKVSSANSQNYKNDFLKITEYVCDLPLHLGILAECYKTDFFSQASGE
jgi:hypothetical protein